MGFSPVAARLALTATGNSLVRAAEWLATSDAEHAVSNEAHGPCMPSANDTRPEAIDRELVDVYTLRPSGLPPSSCANSVA